MNSNLGTAQQHEEKLFFSISVSVSLKLQYDELCQRMRPPQKQETSPSPPSRAKVNIQREFQEGEFISQCSANTQGKFLTLFQYDLIIF